MRPRRRSLPAWVALCGAPGLAQAEPTASAPGPSPSAGGEVVVHGDRPGGYAAHGQITGSRANRPVADVPQSMAVVPAVLLEDMGARRIEDALALTPSVQLGSGFGLLWEDYFVRGSRVWSGTLYRNGYLGGFSSISAMDAVNVERVEVLRGPAAALYGPGLPGGSINVITKRPSRVTGGSARVAVGSFGTQRVAVDANGLLAEHVSARITGAVDQTDGYRDFNDASRFILNPSAMLELSPSTRLLVETQAFRVRYRPDSRGVPIVAGDRFALPTERSLVEPTTPMTRFDGTLVRAELEHRIDPDLSLRIGVQRQAALQDERALIFLGLEDDGRTLDRLATHYSVVSEDVSVQAGLEWQAWTGPVEHDIVAGADLRTESVDWRVGAAAGIAPIDVFTPVYHGPVPPVVEQSGPDNVWTYRDAGVYLNDVVRLTSSARVVASGRLDAYEQGSIAPIASVDESRGELAPSGRIGALYDFTRWLSAYGSLSRGFWPVLGISADTKLLAPERSLGAEVGTRLASARDTLTLDVATFQTWNRDITLPDPVAPDFQVQRDRAVSRGLETSISARPIHQLRLMGSYTLADARVTADSDAALIDTRLPFVSRHSGGGWLHVRVPFDALAVVAGGGFRVVGARPLNDGVMIPGYFRADATAGVEVSAWTLSLLAQNVADTRHVQSGYDRSAILYGTPRAFLLSLTQRFDRPPRAERAPPSERPLVAREGERRPL